MRVGITCPRNTCLFPGFEVLASHAPSPSSPLPPSPRSVSVGSDCHELSLCPDGDTERERKSEGGGGREKEGGREALTSEQKIYSPPAPQCPSDIGAKKVVQLGKRVCQVFRDQVAADGWKDSIL